MTSLPMIRLSGTILPMLAMAFLLCLGDRALADQPIPSAGHKGDLFVLASQHPLVGTKFPQEIRDHASVIDAVAPMWFGPEDTGEIKPLENCDGPYADYVSQAHALNIKVLPILRNFKPQPMLGDPQAVARCVEQAVALVAAHGFDGIVVDFEHLEAASRQPLVDLVSGIHARLKPQGKLVIVATAARAWKKEYDFPQLAASSDYLYVMTYDYVGTWNKRVGPTAPWRWEGQPRDIQRDLQVILSQGVAPGKLLMGMALYGVDFTLTDDDTQHTGLNILPTNRIRELEKRHQAPAVFEPDLLSSWFDYTPGDGKRHRVWFDDAAAFAGKLQRTRELKMAGIGVWSIRYADQSVGEDLWQALSPAPRP